MYLHLSFLRLPNLFLFGLLVVYKEDQGLEEERVVKLTLYILKLCYKARGKPTRRTW